MEGNNTAFRYQYNHEMEYMEYLDLCIMTLRIPEKQVFVTLENKVAAFVAMV